MAMSSVEWHACFLLILVSLLCLLLRQQAAHCVGLLSEDIEKAKFSRQNSYDHRRRQIQGVLVILA